MTLGPIFKTGGGGGGGDVTTGANVGGQVEVFKQKNVTVLEFRTLLGTGDVTVTQVGDVIEINATSVAGITDGVNLGGGAEVFKQKNLNDLEFRTLVGVDDVVITEVGDTLEIGAPQIANLFLLTDSLFDAVSQLQTDVTTISNNLVALTLDAVTDGANIGAGAFSLFSSKNSNNLEFKTLDEGTNGVSISEAANVITIDLTQDLTTTGSPTFSNVIISNGGSILTGVNAGNTVNFEARDVDGGFWTTFATLTANNTPSFDISIAATVGTKPIAQGFTPYTPTLTNVTNVAASTTSDFGYCRIGNYVFGGGRITIDPTAAAVATELGVSIPIASNFSLFTQCTGSAIASASASLCAAVRADTVNNRIQIVYNNTAELASKEFMVQFFYEVI